MQSEVSFSPFLFYYDAFGQTILDMRYTPTMAGKKVDQFGPAGTSSGRINP